MALRRRGQNGTTTASGISKMNADGADIREQVGQELLREHVRAVATAGCRKMRLVKHGPMVATFIEYNQESGWRSIIDGIVGTWHPDPALSPGVYSAIMYGEEITESEYCYVLATANWSRRHNPTAPEANPLERFSPATSSPVF
jgi:hypothetical protein